MSPLLNLSILVTLLLTRSTRAQDLSASSSTSQAVTTVSSTAPVPQATTTPPAKAPNGDPCGPTVQDNPNYPNTCNLTPVLANSPNPYSINCTSTIDTTKYPTANVIWRNCAASLKSICTKMEDPRTIVGRWIESEYANGCSLGFFLPPFPGSAPRPSGQRCVNIFTALVDSCKTTTTPSTIGSINLRALPGYDPSYWDAGNSKALSSMFGFAGAAVNVGYPSYIVSQNKVAGTY